MKKAVITGASCALGRQIVQSLQGQGWDTVSVVRRRGTNEIRGEILELDMTDYGTLADRLGSFDCLVHLAWNGTRGSARMDRPQQQRNMQCGILAVSSAIDAGCKRVVIAGSQAEYGPHDNIISEEDECYPDSEYGKAKLGQFHKTAELCEAAGVEYCEPRFFSLYGPDDYPESMIMSTLKKMLSGAPCELTQGVQMWDYLYYSDAVDALYRLCTGSCRSGAYNVGSGDSRQLLSYIEEMARITDTKSELLFGAIPYPSTGIVSICPDISKLRRELDWRPQVTFDEGIRRLIDFIRAAESK